MCPVCLTDRWPSTCTRACTHSRTRSPKSEMCSRNYAHPYTCIHAHAGTEADSISHHMRLMGKVMHSDSYMQTHAPAHRRAHTHIHGHSHHSQSNPAACTPMVKHIFPVLSITACTAVFIASFF